MFGFFKKKKDVNTFEGRVAGLSVDDTMLQSYQEKAQEQLPYLIDFMQNHEKDDELFRYAVKSRFEEGEDAEHMWVQVNDFVGDYFIGKLVNEPNTIKLIKYGDPVKVHRKNVEDWILEDFLVHAKVGAFSSEYIRNKANQK